MLWAALGANVKQGIMAGLVLVAGCVGKPDWDSATVPVTGWVLLAEAEDPLASHRPDEVFCPPAAVGVELGVYEVQTGVCTYLAAEQALPVALRRGDRLRGTVWHEGLDAAEPAEAHFALLLDGVVVWEVTRPIPEEAWLEEIEVEVDAPASGTVGIHLHNHGYNAWNLADLSLDHGE